MDDNKSFHRVLRAFTVASSMAIQFAACIVLGIMGGLYLDEFLGTFPLFLILGLLSGVGAGVMVIYRTVTWLYPPNNNSRGKN